MTTFNPTTGKLNINEVKLQSTRTALKLWKISLDDIEFKVKSLDLLVINPISIMDEEGCVDAEEHLVKKYRKLLALFKKNMPDSKMINKQYLYYHNLLRNEGKNYSLVFNKRKFLLKCIVDDYTSLIQTTTLLNQKLRLIIHLLTECEYAYEHKLYQEPPEDLIQVLLYHSVNVMDKVYFRPTLVPTNHVINDAWYVSPVPIN